MSPFGRVKDREKKTNQETVLVEAFWSRKCV